jgi:hypothetical protein
MTSGKKTLLIIGGIFLIFLIAISLWGHFYLRVEILGNEACLGAYIFVDENLKGKFDRRVATIRVRKGNHHFRISKQGYQDAHFDTSITKETYLSVELHPTSDSLTHGEKN